MADFVDQTDVLKVLIAVDVQNCFMNNVFNSGNALNLSISEQSVEMAKEIASMTENKDLVVFTRDFHPLNHISLEDEGREANYNSIWPHHCRNPNLKCINRIQNDPSEPNTPSSLKTLNDIIEQDDIDEKLKEGLNSIDFITDKSTEYIRGNELSYFFYPTSIGEIVYNLNINGREGKYKIGSEASKLESKSENVTEIKNEDFKIVDINTVEAYNNKYITLTKGEQCNKESYSAFNYHIKYDAIDPKNPKKDEKFDSIKKENSTGLWEWILNNKRDKKKIVITVCGLVGNVCVMHTVLEGLSMWENIYKNENIDIDSVEFQLSLKGTRFTPALPPYQIKSFEKNILEELDSGKMDFSNKSNSYRTWFNFNVPKNPENEEKYSPFKESIDAFFPKGTNSSLTFLDYDGEKHNFEEPEKTGGRKRTRKNKRNCSMNMRHKSSCKCRMCGGKKRTTKNRRITKRRRH